MTNAEGGLALAQEIVLGIAREYGWSDYEPHKALRLTPEALLALAGKYQLDEVDRPEGKLPAMECQAAVRDGRLFWTPKGLPRARALRRGTEPVLLPGRPRRHVRAESGGEGDRSRRPRRAVGAAREEELRGGE